MLMFECSSSSSPGGVSSSNTWGCSRSSLFPSSVSPFSHGRKWQCDVQTWILDAKPEWIPDPLALFHRWSDAHLYLLFSSAKAVFQWFSISVEKQRRPTPRWGQDGLLFSKDVGMIDQGVLQLLHQHHPVPFVPALAADDPLRCHNLMSVWQSVFSPLLSKNITTQLKGSVLQDFNTYLYHLF